MHRHSDFVRLWDSREPLGDEFASAWIERLARAPHHNFSMTLDYLRWEAQHGRRAVAALVDEGDRRAAFVLRHVEGGEFHCGWPWRWQAVMDDPTRDGPLGMSPQEAAWLFEHIESVAHPVRLRFFAPHPAPDGVPSYMAGRTLMQSLAHPDDAFLKAMDSTKRRGVRRSRDSGCQVVEASTTELFRAFAEVQLDTKTRHGESPAELALQPGAGEDWREWELPWMWLLLAVREQRVVSGFGLALAEGGLVEGRTSATSEEGRKLGAFPMLVYEAAIRARDRGYRWHNNGGDTFFKRDVLGPLAESLGVFAWLGGGRRWRLANQSEALGRRMAPEARRLQRRIEGRIRAKKPR